MELVTKTLVNFLITMVSVAQQTLQVHTKNHETQTTGLVMQGVHQGSPLSPILFHLLMDDLHDTLHSHLSFSQHGNVKDQNGS